MTFVNITNPVGWLVLGLSVLSTVFGIYKKSRAFFDKNFQKSQQKKNADENIDKVAKTIQAEWDKQLSKVENNIYQGISGINNMLKQPVVQVRTILETFLDVKKGIKQLSFDVLSKGEKQSGHNGTV